MFLHQRANSILLSLAAVVWIILSSLWIPVEDNTLLQAPRRGFLAPEISLPAQDGSTLSLSDFRGQVVLVNFWASWCPPCKAEMPALQAIQVKYQSQGFTILAVNITRGDSLQNAQDFIQQNQYTFPIVYDIHGEADESYQVRLVPSSYLIGPDGIILDTFLGSVTEASLRGLIEPLLAPNP